MKMLTSALAISLALSLPNTSIAAADGLTKLSPEDRKAIVGEVIEYFKANPKELVEAIMEWRQKAEIAAVTPKFPTPVSGNQSGDVTIFEFPDYGCDPCNAVSKIIDKVASDDNGVGIVHHDLPRSGNVMAIQASSEIITANAAGADWRHLRQAFLNEGIQPETRLKALNDVGLVPLSLDTPAAALNIRSNNELAKKTGLQSQPAIVIAVGDKVQALNGTITEVMVLDAIKALRAAHSN